MQADFPRAWWAVPPLLMLLGAPFWLHWWEPNQFIALNNIFAPLPAVFWTGLSLLGNGWGIIGATAPLIVYAPRLLWGWICAAPFAALFARLGKSFIESPRPAAEIEEAQIRIVGEHLYTVSMPSGHTLTAFAVASGIWLAIAAQRRWRHSWLLLLALGTGLSRIAVGAHWPGDVAVGMALGILAGMLGHLLWLRVPASWSDAKGLPLRIVALVQLAAVYTLLTDELDFAENLPLQYLLAALALVSLLLFARKSMWRAL